MLTNYRDIRLEDRACPNCGSPVDVVCKNEGQREKYWFDCLSPRAECTWGDSTATHWSAGELVAHEQAVETFDSRY